MRVITVKNATIDQGWRDMLADAPPDITAGERDAGRLGFYTGAFYTMGLIKIFGASLPKDQFAQAMTAILDELRVEFGMVDKQ